MSEQNDFPSPVASTIARNGTAASPGRMSRVKVSGSAGVFPCSRSHARSSARRIALFSPRFRFASPPCVGSRPSARNFATAAVLAATARAAFFAISTGVQSSHSRRFGRSRMRPHARHAGGSADDATSGRRRTEAGRSPITRTPAGRSWPPAASLGPRFSRRPSEDTRPALLPGRPSPVPAVSPLRQPASQAAP